MKISMQKFKSHLAKYVRELEAGKMLELTSHRKVVARLIGVPQTKSAGVARLLAVGIASWQGGKPRGAAIAVRAEGKPVSAMILEDRG